MEKIKNFSYCGVSVELFNSFFSSERLVTQDIVNTLLEGKYIVKEIESLCVNEKIFNFYHPYTVLDTLSSVGRCMMILTPIDDSTLELKGHLVNYMLSSESVKKKNIFPLVVLFDSSEDCVHQNHTVSIDMIEGGLSTYALCTVCMRKKSINENISALISDLTAMNREEIKSDDIKRIYTKSYKSSGLEEKERVSYSMWLDALEKDIRRLGLDPAVIM